MKKNKDLISIIVPCYNVEKYIERCITSIKEQTINNFEVLLIDDGSTDDTKKVIYKLIENDSRFKYYYKENGGLSDARNFGLKKIKGKYVCFVDSDDYVEKEYLEKLYNEIIDNDVQISICDIKRVYDTEFTIDNIDEFKVKTCMKPAAWNKMFLKDLFNDIEFPTSKWYEDLGTTPKITMQYKYHIIKEPLYNYVQNSSSIMHTYDDRIFDIYEIIENVEKYIKNHKYNKENEKILEFMNVYHILVGTVFRASFHLEFSTKMIKEINVYVSNKYLNWYKNKYIKELPIFYRIYLFILKLHLYSLIYLMLKLFRKKVHL